MTSNTEILLELEMYMQRYRNALNSIVERIDELYKIDKTVPSTILNIKEIALSALDGEPATADDFNEVQDHGPPYSMANPSGKSVKDSPLGVGFAHKDTKMGIQNDPEC